MSHSKTTEDLKMEISKMTFQELRQNTFKAEKAWSKMLRDRSPKQTSKELYATECYRNVRLLWNERLDRDNGDAPLMGV